MDRPSSSDDDDAGRRPHDRVRSRPTHPASTSTHPSSSSKKRQKPLKKPPPHSHAKRRRHARADRRNTDKTYRYGNYDRYYGYRVGASMEDHRLAAMREEWFRGKRVCDVGCNDGLFSLSLARAFSPRSMLCVDIDADLVDRGRGKLEALRRYAAREAREAIEKGEEDEDEDADAGGSGLADAGETLGGVEFRHANAVDFNFGVEKYDAILLLSVTKWIHLNWGDDGLKKVFQKCRDALTPGGCLVVEPQPWKSYKSSLRKRVFGQKLLPPECVERYRDITLRPRDFAGYLLSPEGGFESSETLRVGGSSDDGFDRDILRFVKATGDEE